jgi:hypothetical protein
LQFAVCSLQFFKRIIKFANNSGNILNKNSDESQTHRYFYLSILLTAHR